MQTHACNTATLGAIGSTAKNTRFHVRFKVSGVIRGHPREKAFLGTPRRLTKGAHEPVINEKFWILTAEVGELPQKLLTIFRSQHLSALFLHLRTVRANPDAMHLRAGAPKGKVFFHVPTALKHRTGNDPMNVHLAVANIAQYA